MAPPASLPTDTTSSKVGFSSNPCCKTALCLHMALCYMHLCSFTFLIQASCGTTCSDASSSIVSPDLNGSEGPEDDEPSFSLGHPAMLDCMLQLGATIEDPTGSTPPSSGGGRGSGGEERVPASIRLFVSSMSASSLDSTQNLWDTHPTAGGLTAFASRSGPPPPSGSTSGSNSSSSTYRDHVLVDGHGAVLCILQGLEARPLSGAPHHRAPLTHDDDASQIIDSPESGLDDDDLGLAAAGDLYEVEWLAAEPEDETYTPLVSHRHDVAPGSGIPDDRTISFPTAAKQTAEAVGGGGRGYVPSAAETTASALAVLQGISSVSSTLSPQKASFPLKLMGSGHSGHLGRSCCPSSSKRPSMGRPEDDPESGLEGLLRSFNAEHSQIGCHISSEDSSQPARGPSPYSTARLTIGAGHIASDGSHGTSEYTASKAPGAASDGYGDRPASGVILTARLVPSPASAAVPHTAPYRLVPSPRGALTNLRRQPLPHMISNSPVTTSAGTVGPAGASLQPGTVLLSVRAVGINFRDVLNVSVTHV